MIDENIIKFYKNSNLTKSQLELVNKFSDLLKTDTNVLIIKGYAGTGKTFMLEGFVNYLKAENYTVKLAAPTGRAAKILSNRTKTNASTIHKMIYYLSKKGVRFFDEEDDEDIKYYFSLLPNQDPDNTIYIFDEASMISNEYNENDLFRFGSGYLLDDVIKFIGKGNNRKMIFVGDDCQLPPVNSNISPALDENYLSTKYDFKVETFRLEEIVRQESGSGILENAKLIRNKINSDIRNELKLFFNNEDFILFNDQPVIDKYFDLLKEFDFENIILISHTNEKVKEYNESIRKKLNREEYNLNIGDRIILMNNSYFYSYDLYNGDIGTILSCDQQPEYYRIHLKKKDENGKTKIEEVPLIFRNAQILFNNEIKINCKIFENLLYNSRVAINTDEIRAQIAFFNQRNPELKRKKDPSKYFEALYSDAYINALRIKFAYAVTCHKAQGGEWDVVFLDYNTSMGKLNTHNLRWFYTGITRAKKKLFCFNYEEVNIFDKLKKVSLDGVEIKNSIFELNKNNEQFVKMSTNFEFPNEELRKFYEAVKDCIKYDNLNIESIRHDQYCEFYRLRNEEKFFYIKLFYKKDFKISRVLTDIPENNFYAVKRLLNLENKKIVDASKIDKEQSETEIVFSEEQTTLKEIYDKIKSIIEPLNINIEKIEHLNYNERYTFNENNIKVVIDFIYNKRGMITNINPLLSKCESIELLEKILKKLDEL